MSLLFGVAVLAGMVMTMVCLTIVSVVIGFIEAWEDSGRRSPNLNWWLEYVVDHSRNFWGRWL